MKMDKNDINGTYYDQGRHSHHHQPQLRKNPWQKRLPLW